MSDKVNLRKEVRLKKVTADNWEEVMVELGLRASQENLLASNLYSVAEAQLDPDVRPRANYAGKHIFSFLMYEVQKTKDKANEASIYRFMIDRKHQCKGYYHAALSKALEKIRAISGGEQDIDLLHAEKSNCEAVLRQLQLRGGGAGPRWRGDRGSETVMSSDGKVDLLLHRAIYALTVPGLLIGYRVISQGDELALLHEEMASLPFPAIERCRASGAARRVARELMNSMGFAGLPILRSTFGSPIWPAGVVGSMAHDDQIAVAALGLRRHDLDAVGIDIEPATPLPSDMLELIAATPRERCAIADNPLGTNLLFAIKEAVYKAAYPLDHEFLDFHDIEIDLAGRLATTRTGRTLTLHWCVFSRMLVVATVQKASMR